MWEENVKSEYKNARYIAYSLYHNIIKVLKADFRSVTKFRQPCNMDCNVVKRVVIIRANDGMAPDGPRPSCGCSNI